MFNVQIRKLEFHTWQIRSRHRVDSYYSIMQMVFLRRLGYLSGRLGIVNEVNQKCCIRNLVYIQIGSLLSEQNYKVDLIFASHVVEVSYQTKQKFLAIILGVNYRRLSVHYQVNQEFPIALNSLLSVPLKVQNTPLEYMKLRCTVYIHI